MTKLIVALRIFVNAPPPKKKRTYSNDIRRENQLDATQRFIELNNSLNMFQAQLCPSLGARDYKDVHSVWHMTLVMAGCWRGVWLWVVRPG
jgi:hypothetical protein